jgi:hypothetical protein
MDKWRPQGENTLGVFSDLAALKWTICRTPIQFLQTGFTIILGLALGEAFRQLVPDGDKDIRKDRIAGMLAFMFMIVPFFHGMSRYFFVKYLEHPTNLKEVAGHVMFDGLTFMAEAAIFFVMCRSLSPSHWVRFCASLMILLVVDSLWTASALFYGEPVLPWLILNALLGFVVAMLLAWNHPFPKYSETNPAPSAPLIICAVSTFITTVTSYILMRDFYFP